MNLSTLKTLLCCLLVTAVLGCRKDINPDSNLANCRIVKESQRTNWGIFTGKPDTITVEGKQVLVYPQSSRVYSYDQQGRIIREDPAPAADGEVYWTTYIYGQNGIIKTQRIRNASKELTEYITIIPLNERGLDSRNHYDADGYVISALEEKGQFTKTRVNGNLVKSTQFGKDYTIQYTGTFDTTRLNIPTRYPFQGREDRNLLVEEVAFSPELDRYGIGEQYRTNYYYTFDTYGRVTRMIRSYHSVPNYWTYIRSNGQILVTDYEYECP